MKGKGKERRRRKKKKKNWEKEGGKNRFAVGAVSVNLPTPLSRVLHQEETRPVHISKGLFFFFFFFFFESKRKKVIFSGT